MVFETLLDPVLGWVLAMPLWLGILVLSLIMTLLINLIYKFVTDQEEMKRLKTTIKEKQKEMKAHKNDIKKMQKVQAEMMEVNMKYTKKSLKPTLYTFLPLIIIFGWMNANLAYGIIGADEPVIVTTHLEIPARVTIDTDIDVQGEVTKETIEKQASWTVSGPPGEHHVAFATEDGATAEHFVVIADKPREVRKNLEPPFKSVEVAYTKAHPFGGFNIFGYRPGWLMTYIFFSITLSIATRKIFKIY